MSIGRGRGSGTDEPQRRGGRGEEGEAEWRGRRLIRQAVDQTLDSVLEDRDVEVDQEADGPAAEAADTSIPGPSTRWASIAAPMILHGDVVHPPSLLLLLFRVLPRSAVVPIPSSSPHPLCIRGPGTCAAMIVASASSISAHRRCTSGSGRACRPGGGRPCSGRTPRHPACGRTGPAPGRGSPGPGDRTARRTSPRSATR